MKSLIWKQWHESRGYFLIFSGWMMLVSCYAVWYEWAHGLRAIVGSYSGMALLCGEMSAIFLGMRTSCGELSSGTLSFTTALPVSTRMVGAVRLGGGILALSIPIVIGACLVSVALMSGLVEQAGPRDQLPYQALPERSAAPISSALEQLWSVTAIAVVGGIQLFLVSALVGTVLRSESQVGLAGAVAALGGLIGSSLYWSSDRQPFNQMVYGIFLPQSLVVHWGYGVEGGSYSDHELVPHRWVSLGLGLPLLAFLGYAFTVRYGRLRRPMGMTLRQRWCGRLPSAASWIPLRFRSRLGAMIWLEFRQAVPIACWGLLLAVLIAVAVEGIDSTDNVLSGLPHAMFIVGILWGGVVGSSLYSADLGEGLGSFWRSRPISPGLWYWTKYVIGLAAVVVILDGTTIVASWNAPREGMTRGMSWAYVGCFPIVHAWLYSLAVLGTCWFRKPVIGGLCAIVGFMVLTTVITSFSGSMKLEPIQIYNEILHAERMGVVDFTQHGYPLVYGGLAALIFAAGVAGARLSRPLERGVG